MIANVKSLEKYCSEYTKIENYEEAVKSPLRYDLHHRREISENKSTKDLIDENLYYGRPPEELIFLSHVEHSRLHNANRSEETKKKLSDANKGDKNPMFGKHRSTEARQKLSAARKGKHPSTETRQKISKSMKGVNHKGDKNPMFGKHRSTEARQKLSEAYKGRHWHLENRKRVWTD